MLSRQALNSVVARLAQPRCARALSSSSNSHIQFKDTYGAFIDGKEYRKSGQATFDVENPATGEFICKVEAADTDITNHAIEVAHRTYQSGVWSKADVRVRAKVLQQISIDLRARINELAELEVVQTGRAVREMKAQLGRLPEWFEYFSALIRTHEGSVPPFFGPYVNYVNRVPLGVCGLLTPWNHPLLIAIKKIAPALAAGNSIVLKPSELAPISVLELAKLCTDAGLPDGVLNVIPGIGPETGQALCKHDVIRKIDLTGGTNTGRLVGAAAGANLAGVITELGGKAPMLIFDDADIDQAVNGAAFATFVASGQTCIMGARLIIHTSVYDKFMSALKAKAEKIRMGDPFDMNTQMGPVISGDSMSRIHGMIETARSQGATVVTGGEIAQGTLPAPFDKGYYYPPTILEVEPTKHDIWREEVFGPVVVAVPFETEEEAIHLANDSPYGLAAAIWTRDVMRAHRVADEMDVGIVWINDHHRNDPSSPWGGTKDSGVGRENGLNALHEYTQARSVVVRTEDSKWDWFEQQDARYS
jgi:acyl-CoA reductase-like NAD-dependent aldehyde dehydrogenase